MMSYLLALLWAVLPLVVGCGDGNCEETGCDDGNVCTADVCNTATGACETTVLPDASVCEAGGQSGVCITGACVSLSCDGIECDDGNPCTTDACLEGLGACVSVAVDDMTVCERNGAFGRCEGTECDFSLPPTGSAELQLSLTGVDPTLVGYQLSCAGDLELFGSFAKVGDSWEAALTLPAGDCDILVSAQNADREVICSGSEDFRVLPDAVTALELVLVCGV